MKKLVVIGFLGTQLDYGGRGTARWDKWRPSVALCQQDDLPIHRLELLHDQRSQGLAERIRQDIAAVSPETEFRSREIEQRDPWDFEEVYTTLHDFARAYPFDTENEDYLVHITTGTHVAQICWFLLAEARFLPARLLQVRLRTVEDGYLVHDCMALFSRRARSSFQGVAVEGSA